MVKADGDAVMDPETSAHSQLLEMCVLLRGVSTLIPSGLVPKGLHRGSPAGQHGSHGNEHGERKVGWLLKGCCVPQSACLLLLTRKYSLIKCLYRMDPNHLNGEVERLVCSWYARMVSISPSHSAKISANRHSLY